MASLDRLKQMGGEVLPDGFTFASDNNDQWLDVEGLRELLKRI